MNLINDYVEGWRYYNHALIPTCSPDKQPNFNSINNNIWFCDRKPLFIRWTDNFDCKFETNFWYVIKDEPFDINELTSHYRNQIKKGVKNFDFKKINPQEYSNDIIKVQERAFRAYGKESNEIVDKNIYDNCEYFGVFNKETSELCGYTTIYKTGKCIHFNQMVTNPIFEKNGISEALVYGLLQHFDEDLRNDMYINDGTRNILHNTNFQNYLIKKFHFRKAYCKLNIRYSPVIKVFVYLLYPFRKIIRNNKIKATLLMQEIVNIDKKLFSK